jgi:hypothetical protein
LLAEYEAVEGRTVSGIRLEHFLHDVELFGPIGFSPPIMILIWAVWNILKTPPTVVPNPVNLWVLAEGCHRQGEIDRQKIVDLAWRPAYW